MRTLIALSAVAIFSGCSTAARVRKPAPASVVTVEPPIRVHPARQTMTAPTAVVGDAPLAVWQNTQIVKVRVAPYVNEKGEAFTESFKYVIAESGQWNLDALQNPERAFIPNENAPKPAAALGVLQGTFAPGFAPSDTTPVIQSARVVYDMSQIRVTGYFETSDEAKVQALADGLRRELGELAIGFDHNLGWIIMPRTAVLPSPGSVPATLPARIPAVTPAKTATGDRDIK